MMGSTKSTEIEPPRNIMISQYFKLKVFFPDQRFCDLLRETNEFQGSLIFTKTCRTITFSINYWKPSFVPGVLILHGKYFWAAFYIHKISVSIPNLICRIRVSQIFTVFNIREKDYLRKFLENKTLVNKRWLTVWYQWIRPIKTAMHYMIYSVICIFQILYIPKFCLIWTNCLIQRYFTICYI